VLTNWFFSYELGVNILFYGLSRVHGTKAAELPFVATDKEHQH
jgi:hypothetical protein